MPDDVPPRPGAPGYDEFIAHNQAAKDAAKPAAGVEKVNPQTAPAASGPANDQATANSGLY